MHFNGCTVDGAIWLVEFEISITVPSVLKAVNFQQTLKDIIINEDVVTSSFFFEGKNILIQSHLEMATRDYSDILL